VSALLPTLVDVDVLVRLLDLLSRLVPHVVHDFAFTIHHLQSVLFLYTVPLHDALTLDVICHLVIIEKV